MLQFYFLSILANLVGGVTLCSEWLGRRPGVAGLLAALSSRYWKMTTGLVAIIAGLAKLFVPVGSPLVLGDLVPGLVGMTLGVALLFEVLKQEAILPAERGVRPDTHGRGALGYRTALGVLGFAAAILHFFLPERPFV
jgi:hypothetical protein